MATATKTKEPGVDFVKASYEGKIIVFHTRKPSSGKPFGTIIAIEGSPGMPFVVGWSKCKSKLDVFDSHSGIIIAVERAKRWKENPAKMKDLPHSMRPYIDRFVLRCERFFMKNLGTIHDFIERNEATEDGVYDISNFCVMLVEKLGINAKFIADERTRLIGMRETVDPA